MLRHETPHNPRQYSRKRAMQIRFAIHRKKRRQIGDVLFSYYTAYAAIATRFDNRRFNTKKHTSKAAKVMIQEMG